MDQGRGDFGTLRVIARRQPRGIANSFGRFQGEHIPWRSHQSGIWQYARDVSRMPLNRFVGPGAAIDEQSQPSGRTT